MINIELNQNSLTKSQKIRKKDVYKIEQAINLEFKIKKLKEICVSFVAEDEIKKINKKFRKINKITDVLSFDYNDSADILICYARAKDQAKKMKHSVNKEIFFLIIHGILHVFGYSDETENEQKKMFKKQKKILLKLRINPEIYYD